MEKMNCENNKYERPKMFFVKTELFENVANECWANPSLYCLIDPTDEDECGHANYADLASFMGSANGCNQKMKEAVQSYLVQNYGTGTGHYLTDQDIYDIMSSGGGNMGTPLKESKYIQKVRS